MKNKILLTGHRGFIGSALKPRLEEKGYRVHAPEIDITKHDAVRELVRKSKPDYVVHLAAVTTTSDYSEHPLKTVQTNFLATANLAEACRDLKNFRQFIFASAAAVYAPMTGEKLDEDSRLQPWSSYGVAKLSSELYLQYLGTAYGLNYTIFRIPNVYGRGTDYRFFVESMILHMLKAESVRINNPEAVRDWLYIDDAVYAFVSALDNKRTYKQVFLLGTGKGHSTGHIAEMISGLTDYQGKIERGQPVRAVDVDKMICDYTKAKRILGWEPKWSLERGLEETVKKIEKELRKTSRLK